MLEKDIQKRVNKKLKDAGWIVLKLMLLARRGFPDLLCLKNGRVLFIECKAPGKKPTKMQLYRHEELRKHGFDTIVIDDPNQIKLP